jgi:hypothetical protein
MKYYYLDGIEKKGPYTLEEILSRNLSSDTMIYREDKTNWIALSDFEELKIIVSNKSETLTKTKSKNNLFKVSLFYYFFICCILALIRTILAVVSYENNKGNINRYPSVFMGQIDNTETMYGNQQNMLFRGVKLDTIYLNADEQNSYFSLFFNILTSNLVSLSFIFIISYIYMYINNKNLNNHIKNFKIISFILIILILIIFS